MRRLAFVSLSAAALAANAQPGPPGPITVEVVDPISVEVINDESNAVPVTPVGRQPYQSVFDVTSSTGGEVCSPIPIPEGKMLTLTSVGVTAVTDGAAVPETWIRVLRRRPSGFSIFRFLDDLQNIGNNRWSGHYEPEVFGGTVINSEFQEISYELSICVGPPDFPATFNDARGVISGYLTDGGIVDGLSIPPQ